MKKCENYGKIMKCALCGGFILAVVGLIGAIVCAILHYGRIYPMKSYLPMALIVLFGGLIISLIGVIGMRLDCREKSCGLKETEKETDGTDNF